VVSCDNQRQDIIVGSQRFGARVAIRVQEKRLPVIESEFLKQVDQEGHPIPIDPQQ